MPLLLALILCDATPRSRALDPKECGLLKTIAPMGGQIGGLAFSPDGCLAAVGCADATVRIYDSWSWRPLRKLSSTDGAVQSLAFSRNGKTLAVGTQGGLVTLWDAEAGTPIRAFAGHKGGVTSLAFSYFGDMLLSCGADGGAAVWDVAGGRTLKELDAPSGTALCGAFSPDGRRVATGSRDATIRIWRTDTWKEEKTFQGHKGPVSALAFSPDGKRLASGSTAVFLWNVERGEIEWRWAGHSQVAAVAFTPNGRHIISAGEVSARIWDAVTGVQVSRLRHHTREITGLALHPGGDRFATIGADRLIMAWGRVPGGVIRLRPKALCGLGAAKNPSGPGAQLVGVDPRSAGGKAGLQVGDVVKTAGGVAVNDHPQLADVIGTYCEGDGIDFVVEREGGTSTIKVVAGGWPEPPGD